MTLTKQDIENLESCPWCGSRNMAEWGRPVRKFNSVVCGECKLIYVRNRLNGVGLKKYYATYLSDMHQADTQKNVQREQMYKLEFDLINGIVGDGKVLDVGCSAGLFLDLFKAAGYECCGVEFGSEAAEEASKKHNIHAGEFSKLEIHEEFDLIIFRGVIEHIPTPKSYLEKAVRLLKTGGHIFITSTPNADAVSCDIFKEMWNQHVP